MNYTLHQLQIFLKICETQSITKAAEQLNLTQPAVSIQLRNFQDQFDIPLTEIVGKKIFITAFGLEISEIAQSILQKVEEIQYKSDAYKGLLVGKLTIAAVSTGKYVIPYFLTEFLQEYTGIELVLDVTNKSKVLDSVANNEVDFGLVSILPETIAVFNESLLSNEIVLVAGRKNYEKYHTTAIHELDQLPVIFREQGSGTRFKMEQFFKQHNIQIKRKLELTSNEAVKQAVIADLGVSIMPVIGIKNELKNGDLKIISLKELPIITDWNLIWNSHKSLTPVAKAYLEYVKKNKQSIIAHHW